eukprot:COSAG01_NODE_14713_length_1418_cov_303.733889_2_plen_34_part_01
MYFAGDIAPHACPKGSLRIATQGSVTHHRRRHRR